MPSPRRRPPRTAAEKLLGRAARCPAAAAGDFVRARVDLVLLNELSANRAVDVYQDLGSPPLAAPRKVVVVLDHVTPAKDLEAAALGAKVRAFARRHRVRWFEAGRGGVEHILLPEAGLVRPGDLIVGGDSHTCTYGAAGAFATGVGATDAAVAMALGDVWLRVPETFRVNLRGRLAANVGGKDVILHLLGRVGVDGARYQTLEFAGPGVPALPMHGRFTVANMAVEGGAKNALFPVDAVAARWLRAHGVRSTARAVASDDGARFAAEVEVDLSALVPLVACPDLPSNVRPARELRDVAVDQVVLGCCTNGWLEDLRAAARVLGGRRIHDRVRLIVVPGTQRILVEAAREGLVAALVEAGALLMPPGCGPCLGAHQGVLAAGEVALSTTNRNFVGRMGHRTSRIYLAGPEVAAATALLGRIADPAEVAR